MGFIQIKGNATGLTEVGEDGFDLVVLLGSGRIREHGFIHKLDTGGSRI